ncbi:MAG: DUF1854 domain-containing protein [Betaproteobacteria bacterium]|nr:DUF1854 domain-containing protein [Betaproteobacteria bacterium]
MNALTQTSPAGGFSLERNAFGKLVLIDADGKRYAGIVPVRAFPLAAPDEGVSLLSAEGYELAWIPSLSELRTDLREHIEQELASREFVPEILRLKQVSSFATPSTWEVETNRGATRFILKGEEDIRRLGHTSLLIADSHGIQFLIRDLTRLDRHSRKLLDRFL